MTKNNMATHKRINITIHPIELNKLKAIAKKNNETISGMITRLIQEYKQKKDDRDQGDLTDPDYDRRYRCKGKNQ